MRSPLLPVLAAGVFLSACGSLDPNTGSAPALATVQGSLSNPDALSVAGARRVAVVWRSIRPGQFNVAEDLPVQAVFPAAFTIELDGPPPAEAMNSAAPSTSPPPSAVSTGGGSSFEGDSGSSVSMQSVRVLGTSPPVPNANLEYAIGTVVAYVDENANGKLDLVPEGAPGYIDQIVASNTDIAIFYLQGPLTDMSGAPLQLTDSAGHVPRQGYNLVTVPHCDAPSPASGPWGFGGSNPACPNQPPPPVVDAGSCSGMLWLPMSSPFTLKVASTPEVAALMCANGGSSTGGATSGSGGGPADPSVQPAQYPDPCDPNLLCAADGSDFQLATCVTVSQGLCRGTLLSCTSVGYSRPTPVPAAWPCIH